MRRAALAFANIALHALHLGIVLGAGIGWVFCQTRLATLALQGAILFSWFLLGPLTGRKPGYCLVTDMQWRLRHRIGMPARAGGYVKYLLDGLSGRDLDPATVDYWTLRAFFAALAANIAITTLFGWC